MSAGTPSRAGQINGAGAVDALWLKIFSGEVLTAYETTRRLKPTVRVRQIPHGNSAQFPAVWDAVASYHTPGANVTGQAIRHNEVNVTLDDMLIAPVEVAQIDELRSHYDVRAPYAEALGRALALFEDRTIGQCIVNAARGAALFTGDLGGVTVNQAAVSGTANFNTSGADLVAAINLAKQLMDEREVPVDSMPVYAAFRPAQYYLIANSNLNINKDFGGQGSLQSNKNLSLVSDVNVMKSNGLLFGFDVTPFVTSTNTDGIVQSAGGISATLPLHGGLPLNYPTKYHADLTNTRGVVYCEPAVAYLQLLGLTMESEWLSFRQVTLMLAKMAIGMGPLRSKCAAEIRTT